MSIEFEEFPGGVVVNDGQFLWTASKAAVKKSLAALKKKGEDIEEPEVYGKFCRMTPYLQKANPALHDRLVKRWRKEHDAPGNWS